MTSRRDCERPQKCFRVSLATLNDSPNRLGRDAEFLSKHCPHAGFRVAVGPNISTLTFRQYGRRAMVAVEGGRYGRSCKCVTDLLLSSGTHQTINGHHDASRSGAPHSPNSSIACSKAPSAAAFCAVRRDRSSEKAQELLQRSKVVSLRSMDCRSGSTKTESTFSFEKSSSPMQMHRVRVCNCAGSCRPFLTKRRHRFTLTLGDGVRQLDNMSFFLCALN